MESRAISSRYYVYFYRRCLCMIKFWNKLIFMDRTRLPSIIFHWDMVKCNNNFSADIENVFDMIGFPEFYITKNLCPISLAKECLYSNMNEEWLQNITTKPKLRTYVHIKQSVSTANYLNVYMHQNTDELFSLNSPLRLGALPLEIETGRYKNVNTMTGSVIKV